MKAFRRKELFVHPSSSSIVGCLAATVIGAIGVNSLKRVALLAALLRRARVSCQGDKVPGLLAEFDGICQLESFAMPIIFY